MFPTNGAWVGVGHVKTYEKVVDSVFRNNLLEHDFSSTKGRQFEKHNDHICVSKNVMFIKASITFFETPTLFFLFFPMILGL
jgi:hypothetical protein